MWIMQSLVLTIFLLFSPYLFGGTVKYTCDSNYGQISASISDRGTTRIDFSAHEMIGFKHSYSVFNEMLKNPEENFSNYILKIDKESYSNSKGTQFLMNKKNLLVRSKYSAFTEKCQVSFQLSRVIEVANLVYKCSTLRKNHFYFEDQLVCRSIEVGQ